MELKPITTIEQQKDGSLLIKDQTPKQLGSGDDSVEYNNASEILSYLTKQEDIITEQESTEQESIVEKEIEEEFVKINIPSIDGSETEKKAETTRPVVNTKKNNSFFDISPLSPAAGGFSQAYMSFFVKKNTTKALGLIKNNFPNNPVIEPERLKK